MSPFALWRKGLQTIPVPRFGRGGDGKTPRLAWKPYQTRRVSAEEMRRWFRSDLPVNVAIITGKISGVTVVDIDGPEALMWVRLNLKSTPWIVKTQKGYHIYFRYTVPFGNRTRVKIDGNVLPLDVRSDGGYVIGPGSVHKSGAIYEAVGDWSVPRDKLPVFPVDLLATPEPVSTPYKLPQPAGDAVDRARAYLRAVPEPVIGCGSDALTFAMACRLVRGLALDEDTALGLLQEWAPHFDLFWLREKIRSAVRHGREPIGGMLASE